MLYLIIPRDKSRSDPFPMKEGPSPPHTHTADRSHWRNPQLIKIQKTSDCGLPSDGGYTHSALLHPRLKEYCGKLGRKTVRTGRLDHLLGDSVSCVLQGCCTCEITKPEAPTQSQHQRTCQHGWKESPKASPLDEGFQTVHGC